MEQTRPPQQETNERVSCIRVKEDRHTLISDNNTDAWISSTATISLSENR